VHQIAKKNSLVSLIVEWKAVAMIFSVSASSAKGRWTRGPKNVEAFDSVIGGHSLEHVIMNMCKVLVPDVKALETLFLGWNTKTTNM